MCNLYTIMKSSLFPEQFNKPDKIMLIYYLTRILSYATQIQFLIQVLFNYTTFFPDYGNIIIRRQPSKLSKYA